ncbi:MAG: hypothetical protein DRI90_03940 [Deltaproteobacteria bacterium]|nr:MAG: hypothetical protein DRI90_03940 [Deltaproteobacteria bacterium]
MGTGSRRKRVALDALGAVPVLLLVFGPLLVLGIALITDALSNPASWLELMIPSSRRVGLLLSSLAWAAAVAATSMALGGLAASALLRWRRGLLRWLLLVLAPIPPHVHALAWLWLDTAVLSSRAVGLQLGGGWLGAWWVQTMAMLPLGIGVWLLAMEGVDPVPIEAARVLAPGPVVWRRVVLPQVAPLVLVGFTLVLTLSLTDFTVPSLFGVTVYALEIFAEFSATGSSERALALALPLLLVSGAAVFVLQRPLRHVVQRQPEPFYRHPQRVALEQVGRGPRALGLIALGLHLAVPAAALLVQMPRAGALMESVGRAQSNACYSVVLALAVALASMSVAMGAAPRMLRRDWVGRALWAAFATTLAMPAALTGMAMLALRVRLLPWAATGDLLPWLACTARFAPLACLAAAAQARRIDPALSEAARLLPVNRWRCMTRVELPLLAPGLLVGGCIAFALTLGELGATLLVIPPGSSTLTIRIYNYLHYGASESVAGLAALAVGATAAAGLTAVVVLRAWARVLDAQPRRRA